MNEFQKIDLLIQHIQNEKEAHSINIQNTLVKQQLHLLKKINLIQPSINKIKLEEIQNQILKHFQKYNQLPEMKQAFIIKFYTQTLISCILENNQTDGQLYIKKLINNISTLADMQLTLSISFNIKSLNILSHYKMSQNKEFKYDLVTQTLLFYILSQTSSNESNFFNFRCKELINKIIDQGRNMKFIQNLASQLQSKNYCKNYFSRVLKTLVKKQKQLIESSNSIQKHQITIKQLIADYCKITYNYDIRKDDSIIDHKFKQKISNQSIQILKMAYQQKNQFVLRQLEQTSFIKKLKSQLIVFHKKRIENGKIQNYHQTMKIKGNGQIFVFKQCKQGMYLQKLNFNNAKIVVKFVYLGMDGIYWGKERKDGKLKFEWNQIKGVLYGNVSANINKNYHLSKGQRNFTILLEKRTIDLMCSSSQQAHSWIRAILYALNRFWAQYRTKNNQQNICRRYVRYTKGYLYWRELIMRLRKEGQPWEFKAKGIIEIARLRKRQQ